MVEEEIRSILGMKSNMISQDLGELSQKEQRELGIGTETSMDMPMSISIKMAEGHSIKPSMYGKWHIRTQM